jgi:hypothetical protein
MVSDKEGLCLFCAFLLFVFTVFLRFSTVLTEMPDTIKQKEKRRKPLKVKAYGV